MKNIARFMNQTLLNTTFYLNLGKKNRRPTYRDDEGKSSHKSDDIVKNQSTED